MKSKHLLLLCLIALLCSAAPGGAASLIYNFPLNSNPGWGTEEPGPSARPAERPATPASAHTGSYVYGYNLAGSYANSIPAYSLTTSALDCSSVQGATLVFWRWLGVENNAWDHAYVQVSNDGSTWTTLWQNLGTTISYENYWQLCIYDMSAVADGQSTVYVRWVMGPTDSSVVYCGWNIDDVQIWAGPPLGILAWNAYSDLGAEYPNTLQALTDEFGSSVLVQPFTPDGQTAGDATKLSRQLEGKHVFLAPEQENATPTQATTAGTEFASTLQSFASNGGTVVACGEGYGNWTSQFLSATGLMSASYYGVYYLGESLPVTALWHPLAQGVGSSIAAYSATGAYTVDANTLPVVEDGLGHTILGVRDYGAGAAIILGSDFYEYDSETAQLLANAVQYPKQLGRRVLLYSDSPYTHRGAEALRRLGYAFTQTSEGTFDEALTSGQWDLVVLDNPNFSPYGAGGYGYYDSLLDYLGVWGKSVANTWQLTYFPDLETAYSVDATTMLTDPATVYQWTSSPFFTTPNIVPNLASWSDPGYGIDGYKLTAVGDGVAYAGYTAGATAGEAAVVAGNFGTTLINGFIWDEAGQDADGDGVQDVVELVMNQIVDLTKSPYVDVGFSPAATTIGATVAYQGGRSATAVSPRWWFGDGSYYDGDSASHAYANPGFYTVGLATAESGGSHYGIRVAPRQLIVGFTDAGPGHWACNYIIACSEAGIVGGYWDGYHPSEEVNRAQMAVFMARAEAGSDAAVPAGPVTATFTDVPTGHWAYKYVEYCVANGIVGGYWDGYHPTETVNRAQMAVFVARAIAGSDAAVPAGPVTATFTDVPTGHWAYKYVEYCVDAGVVGGYWDGYHPIETVNRAQMSVFVQRAYDLWMPY